VGRAGRLHAERRPNRARARRRLACQAGVRRRMRPALLALLSKAMAATITTRRRPEQKPIDCHVRARCVIRLLLQLVRAVHGEIASSLALPMRPAAAQVGAVHRRGDTRAQRAPPRPGVPAVGPLRAAEGHAGGHHAAPRAHRRAPLGPVRAEGAQCC